jgi:hypothetical protein
MPGSPNGSRARSTGSTTAESGPAPNTHHPKGYGLFKRDGKLELAR